MTLWTDIFFLVIVGNSKDYAKKKFTFFTVELIGRHVTPPFYRWFPHLPLWCVNVPSQSSISKFEFFLVIRAQQVDSKAHSWELPHKESFLLSDGPELPVSFSRLQCCFLIL